MSSRQGWKPTDANPSDLSEEELANLDALLLEHLRTKMPVMDAVETIEKGRIPENVVANLTGAETELLGEIDTEKKLIYIGNKTISKYGCFACHDIPGFEDAKPIGTALAEWGRKETSKLAFEHINEYITHGHGHGHSLAEANDAAHDAEAEATHHDENSHSDVEHESSEMEEEFYLPRILEHDRVGFIWQKLKAPRSYDFRKARNKGYNDRLRMPAFAFDESEREAVITFVLGLVAEPPAHEFVYHPDEHRKALIRGRSVLEKYNCVGCHIVEPEEWVISFDSGEFDEQGSNPAETFPFLKPNFTTAEIAESLVTHPLRGTYQTKLSGMPTIDRDGVQVIYDEYGDPVEEGLEYDESQFVYSFDLWEPTLIAGQPYQVGLNPVEVPASMIDRKTPTYGGDLTKWLMPRVIELEREAEPQADGKQSYGWLPPPLIGQGEKVQTDWLHEFLLNPYVIRPATFMRMPRFNMSSEEATDLVNYFAAKDNVQYPYEYSPWTEASRLQEMNRQYMNRVSDAPEAAEDQEPTVNSRFDAAMNIITSNDYCVKCHIVSDFDPGGAIRAKAPDLSQVYRRLRPEYVRGWIANPLKFLPYTPMPVNIPYNEEAPHLGGVNQQLYHGTSIEQLDAVVDILMNYPRYSSSRAKVADLVKPVVEAETGNAAGAQ